MLPSSLMNLLFGNCGRTLLQYAMWIAPPVYCAVLPCMTSTTVVGFIFVFTALPHADATCTGTTVTGLSVYLERVLLDDSSRAAPLQEQGRQL